MGDTYKFYQGSGNINDNTLTLDFSLRKVSIPLREITGFYRYKSFGMDTLIITFRQEGEKNGYETILLGRENTPEDFIRELVALAPESANLFHMKKGEALKKMGMANRMKGAIALTTVLLVFFLGCIFYPQIYHGLKDRKLATVSVEEIYAGIPVSSGFLTFSAHLPSSPLVVEYRKWWSSSGAFREKRKRGFYPVIPDNWKQGDPVRMVLMVDGGYGLKGIARQEGRKISIKGVVRNILWEKLAWSGSMDALAKHTKSPVEQPIVIEYQASPMHDIIWYVGGTLALLVSFLGLAGWQNRKK